MDHTRLALLRMGRERKTSDDFAGPINLGNPVEFEIRALAELVIKLTSSGSKTVFRPLPSDDPTQRRPDISLAKNILQWEPSTSLETSLRKTIAYLDGLLKGGNGEWHGIKRALEADAADVPLRRAGERVRSVREPM